MTAGLALPERAILKFVAQTWTWVEKSKDRLAQHESSRLQFRFSEGENLLYLGQEKSLRYLAAAGKIAQVYLDGSHLVYEVPNFKWNTFDKLSPHPESRDLIRRFYQAEAEPLILRRLELWSERMNLRPTHVRFRCQRTRWGSCTSTGRISLNWKLMAAPLEVIDYVVIHELAHLRYANHSSRFWQVVAAYAPFYKVQAKWLRDHQQKFEFLLKK